VIVGNQIGESAADIDGYGVGHLMLLQDTEFKVPGSRFKVPRFGAYSAALNFERWALNRILNPECYLRRAFPLLSNSMP
jgi:hypothetical protein